MSNLHNNIENAGRNLFNFAQKDMPSAGREAARHPLQTLTGLGVGAALSIPNNIATLGLGGLGLGNVIMDKPKPFEQLDKYNKWTTDVNRAVVTGNPMSEEAGGIATPLINTAGAIASTINNAIGAVGTPIINEFGKLVNKTGTNFPTDIPSKQEYSPQAAGIGSAIGDLIGPGGYFKALGKVPGLSSISGGVPAIAAQAAIGADRYLGQPILRGTSNVFAPAIDPLLKGAAKVGEVTKSKVVDPASQWDIFNNDIARGTKNIINTRLPEDILKLETSPQVLTDISKLTGKPVSSINDSGEYLFNSKMSAGQAFQKELSQLKAQKAEALSDAKVNKKPSEDIFSIRESFDKKIEKLKETGPNETYSNTEIDDFITKDLGYDTAKMDKKNLAVIREQFKGAYNNHVKKLKTLEGDLSFDNAMSGYNEAKNSGLADEDLVPHYDNVYGAAKDRVAKAMSELDDAALESNKELYDAKKQNLQQVFDDTAAKIYETGNDSLARRFVDDYKNTYAAKIAKFALLGKFENASSDALQYARNQGAVMQNRLDSRGIGYGEYLKNRTGAGEWEKNNPLFVDKLYAEKNKTTADVFANSDEYSNLLDPDFKKSNTIPGKVKSAIRQVGKTGFANIIEKAIDTLGYGMQHTVRRYVTRDIIHDAYAIAKSEGLVEGTEEFNQFVKAEADALLVQNGFSKVKTSFGTLDQNGLPKAAPSFDDWIKEGIEKSISSKNLNKGTAKEIASAVSYMGTWVKDASIANNRSYNNAIDALTNISKTGKVTEADRIAVIRAIYDQASNAIIFGARGARIPGTYTEDISSQIGSDTKKSASTRFADFISELLNFSDADRKRLKDGWYDKLTGTASDRQLNIPATGINPDIFKGTLERYMSGNLFNPSVWIADRFPKELQNKVNAFLGEGVTDYKGNEVTPDLSETAQNSPSLQSGIGLMLTKPTQVDSSGLTATKNDEEGILNKYDRYSLQDMLKDPNLHQQFLDDLARIGIDSSAPKGFERFKNIAKRLKENTEKVPTSSQYKKLNANASKVLSLGEDSPEYLDIKREIAPSRVPQIAAEALLNNKKEMLKALIHLKLVPQDEEKLVEFQAKVRAKVEEIEARKKESDEIRKANNEAV